MGQTVMTKSEGMVTLVLPFPPSMNTYWRNLNGRTLLSAKGRRYKSEVIAAVYEQLKKKPKPITDNVAVKVDFIRPTISGVIWIIILRLCLIRLQRQVFGLMIVK